MGIDNISLFVMFARLLSVVSFVLKYTVSHLSSCCIIDGAVFSVAHPPTLTAVSIKSGIIAILIFMVHLLSFGNCFNIAFCRCLGCREFRCIPVCHSELYAHLVALKTRNAGNDAEEQKRGEDRV